MFNIKFPIRLIILLILAVVVNIFSTVTIEYNVISFQEYRNIEVSCGDLFSVLTTNNIENVSNELKSDWRPCREKAFIVLISSGLSLAFLISLLIYLLNIYKNYPKREEINDLLGILKRMNRK